jgi:hypothetical protein
MERPSSLTGKEVFTEEETAEVERQKARFDAADPKERNVTVPPVFSTARNIGDPVDQEAYNSAWFDVGTTVTSGRRTSLIVDPRDGRVPYTPEGRQRATRATGGGFAGPEDRPLTERCILSFNAGPPLHPGAYNNNVQIVQASGVVAIVSEMIHDARIIPVAGRSHISPDIRQLLGDSRGHWDGVTLVVETTNFTDKAVFYGMSRDARLTERLTRNDANTIAYRFTLEDPVAFTTAWTAEFTMALTKGPMFEYACHEGNKALGNVLSGARAAEK